MHIFFAREARALLSQKKYVHIYTHTHIHPNLTQIYAHMTIFANASASKDMSPRIPLPPPSLKNPNPFSHPLSRLRDSPSHPLPPSPPRKKPSTLHFPPSPSHPSSPPQTASPEPLFFSNPLFPPLSPNPQPSRFHLSPLTSSLLIHSSFSSSASFSHSPFPPSASPKRQHRTRTASQFQTRCLGSKKGSIYPVFVSRKGKGRKEG